MTVTIDTLQFADNFERAGFDHDKAPAFALAQGAGREGLVTERTLLESEARVLKAITDLRKEQSDMDVRLTRQIGESGNNVIGKLWLAVVVVGGLAAAVSAAVQLALRSTGN